MVLYRARPPRREANHDGMQHAAIRAAARRRNIPQVSMVTRRDRPLRREASHDGMLRSGLPRGGLTSPGVDGHPLGPTP